MLAGSSGGKGTQLGTIDRTLRRVAKLDGAQHWHFERARGSEQLTVHRRGPKMQIPEVIRPIIEDALALKGSHNQVRYTPLGGSDPPISADVNANVDTKELFMRG